MENLKTFSQKLRNAPLTTALTVDLQVSYTLCMVLYVQRCLRLSSRSVDMWFGTLPSDWTRFCHLLMSPAVQECAGPGVDASLRWREQWRAAAGLSEGTHRFKLLENRFLILDFQHGTEPETSPALGEEVAARRDRLRPAAVTDPLQHLDPPEPQDREPAGQTPTRTLLDERESNF